MKQKLKHGLENMIKIDMSNDKIQDNNKYYSNNDIKTIERKEWKHLKEWYNVWVNDNNKNKNHINIS